MHLKKSTRSFFIAVLLSLFFIPVLKAETGYELWLRYQLISSKTILDQYRTAISGIYITGNSPTLSAGKEELQKGLKGLLGREVLLQTSIRNGSIVARLAGGNNSLSPGLRATLKEIGKEGYILQTQKLDGKKIILITGNTEVGILYGIFNFLRVLQTNQSIDNLDIHSSPAIKLRLLNHWDNLDRTVERGYAGFSIWNWHTLPGYLDNRYKDYARANASIGINGTILTNVNANATFLTKEYLVKVAALANLFRIYGIKVYLTARFSAPIEIGGLKTADPLDSSVQQWWKEKVNEIYALIPDFGGFLVKANSEGQPGPQNYGRNHAEGANMLADAVAPHGGIVMWRAFVYSNETPDDRHKQAYNEFVPLDGQFRKNVMVQVKNGAIDFQPREPFHPLFGAMPKTPLVVEFQLTQEYLGFATHLVYLAPLFKECLDSDTYSNGKGSTVAKIIDGSVNQQELNGMAGVSNIGNDLNWCGHPFAQANWFALGRLSWDHRTSAEQIADEWLRMTFSNDESFVDPVKKVMMRSRETTVKYMTPMGLHHLMGYGHHYGPAPWVDKAARADWNCTYYHKADSIGIGFNRTSSGSNALGQYATQVQEKFQDPRTCTDEYLLWFHHLPWTFPTKSGKTLWNEMCHQYNLGVDSVRWMQRTWEGMKNKIDHERFNQVHMLLSVQEQEAVWWRNACLLYFQTKSRMPIPAQYEQPNYTLDHYMQLKFPQAPGN